MTDPVSVGGRYQLAEVLGRGGMAEVHRALDTRLGRPVAVKQLRIDLAQDPTFQARFRREAQSAAGLNHPTIVAVYDTGEEPDPRTGVGVPYIVMELVEGPTLRDILREGGKIMPERALELTQGVLDALSYSHKAGIVHRDIKPANVMLTQTGNIKVMDFGIARAVADTSSTMTQTAAVIGTAQYLSPEQARGETVDARSDIYSAGCLLYELLTGRPPFVGDSPVSVAYQHVREAPVPPSRLNPAIGPEIDAITLKALAKAPADRYQSARDMKADIARLLAGEQVTAIVPTAPVPDPNPTRAVPRASELAAASEVVTDEDSVLPGAGEDEDEPAKKRRTGLVVAIIAIVVVVLAGGGVFAYRYFQPPATAMTTVPAVTGFRQAQATSELNNNQLGVGNVTTVNGPDDDTVNTVTKQDPTANSSVPVNTEVDLTVNVGPKSGTIPADLVGKDEDDAKQDLADAGFTNVTTTPATSESTDDKAGEVLSVSPTASTKAPLGNTVTLTVATGDSQVPNVGGQPEAAARSALENAGFKVGQVQERDQQRRGRHGHHLRPDRRIDGQARQHGHLDDLLRPGGAQPVPDAERAGDLPVHLAVAEFELDAVRCVVEPDSQQRSKLIPYCREPASKTRLFEYLLD